MGRGFWDKAFAAHLMNAFSHCVSHRDVCNTAMQTYKTAGWREKGLFPRFWGRRQCMDKALKLFVCFFPLHNMNLLSPHSQPFGLQTALEVWHLGTQQGVLLSRRPSQPPRSSLKQHEPKHITQAQLHLLTLQVKVPRRSHWMKKPSAEVPWADCSPLGPALGGGHHGGRVQPCVLTLPHLFPNHTHGGWRTQRN